MVIKAVWGIPEKTGLARATAILLVVGLFGLGAASASAAVGVTDRDRDPVVITGDQAPNLIGTAPGDVVAFRWEGNWRQVPVQVDERKWADLRVVRQLSLSNPQFGTEVYADAGTYAGADGMPQMYSTGGLAGQAIPGTAGDSNLDTNDEIAMMAQDSGDSAVGRPAPTGVDAGSRTPVRVSDPLAVAAGKDRYLYLFRSTGGLSPDADRDYVSYVVTYVPALAGGYFGGYNFNGVDVVAGGPPANAEASSVSTNSYEQTFPGRWMVDGLKIKAGAATAVDILDGDKSTVGTTGCERNELTFSQGGGGVIAAIDGPVRAIRSYVGANSGTFTQRDQIYYQGRIDTVTYLRVHPGIGSVWTAMDLSGSAKGMTYRNSLNPSGDVVDGVAAALTPGELTWEQTTGPQGTITNVTRISSDLPGLEVTSKYLDSESAEGSSMRCSGDQHAYGAGGTMVTGTGLNTDPVLASVDGQLFRFTATRVTMVGAPGSNIQAAARQADQVDQPLALATGDGVDGEEPEGPPDPDPPDPTTPGRQNWVGLKVSVKPSNARLRPGRARNVLVSVQNIGDKTGRRIRVCPIADDSLVKTPKCKLIKKLKAGNAAKRGFRIRLRNRAAGAGKVKVRFRAKASKSKARSGLLVLRPFGN